MTKACQLIVSISVLLLAIAGCGAQSEVSTISEKIPAKPFVIVDSQFTPTIYLDKDSDPLVRWAVKELIEDIHDITGKTLPLVLTSKVSSGRGIVIGQMTDALIQDRKFPHSSTTRLSLQTWEGFNISQQSQKLWLVGSDVRGTVFAIFDLAERLGISPWKWWADVDAIPQQTLTLSVPKEGISGSPSVQYRGIFLNDEDWGLQPWAAKTFEPDVDDIGPKTYEKIFQLMLRLKANTIWPAMHPSTQGFYTLPGNQEMAQKYHIVVGTSHAEPMLRNNVDEWDKAKFGDYNYFTNSETIDGYWQQRVSEVGAPQNKNIFTLGMRGVHDSHMQGSESTEQSIAMLDQIIKTQRNMLVGSLKKPIQAIPQVLIPYKEVLNLYNNGLQVPDDVTLMWTDDNYGYIRRLSNESEQQRAGGSGVYYHLSYWGRPHDYLWLATTQPGLIWYEMSRAYANDAKKMWIANVGDIKPAEYITELFLDMAWNIDAVSDVNDHLKKWAVREFGQDAATGITKLMGEYYRLAMIRKPEYMGWSQTEPTTQTQLTEFTDVQANKRIQQYQQLEALMVSLKKQIPEQRLSAWFQLIEYPVAGAANMNYKFLYRQLAHNATEVLEQQQYQGLAKAAYQKIIDLTDYYNTRLSDGKWQHIMSRNPRRLPVFHAPKFDLPKTDLAARLNNQLDKTINIQAHQFSQQSDYAEAQWQLIQGLGVSNAAMTIRDFSNREFPEQAKPWLEYEIEITKNTEYLVEVRLLPTHANKFDHQVEIKLDGISKGIESVNTQGRSEAWKTNVLRNAQVKVFSLGALSMGRHKIRLLVNQSGMVVDQLAVYPSTNVPSYLVDMSH